MSKATTVWQDQRHSGRLGVESQLQEALAMAGMVSLTNDLAVELGESWAFNWSTRVITIPQEDLRESCREKICWIILHEAAHAALTRLHEFLPETLRNRPEVAHLLNCVEDVRIERWLVERFPGSTKWRDASYDLALKNIEIHADDHAAIAFLKGIFWLGESHIIPESTPPSARSALLEAAPYLEKAFECLPPAEAVSAISVDALYASHPVASSYREIDAMEEPDPFEKWVRVMQAAMWAHVAEGVLPAFMRLIRASGGAEFPQVRRVEVVGRGGRGKRVPGADGRPLRELESSMRDKLVQGGNSKYLQAVQRYAQEIREVTDTLMELLPNHRNLQYVRRQRSGDRLDLRMAAQFAADRRLYDQIWMQRKRRTLPDPAFVFLVDRSGSMRDEGKSKAAYESLVIVREACTRANLQYAVVVFNDAARLVQGWERQSDAVSEASLSVVLEPEGGTDLEVALVHSVELLRQRPERDRIIFLLSDGMVERSQEADIRRYREDLLREGIGIVAIGLGDEAVEIDQIFPKAPVLDDARELPSTLSKCLLEALASVA
jgi:Mg-chelatase subunit ChlD